MKRTLILFLFSLLLINQTAAEKSEVFAPFVSRLKAISGLNTVKLTWLDSEDNIKQYNIYRYSERITSSNFIKSTRIGTVRQGKQIFIDIPEDTESYYYSVLAVDNSGNEYKLFIPYRNITMEGSGVKSVSSPEMLAAVITDINTAVLDSEIKISFKTSKPDREVVIYRSTTPIQEQEDITNASIAGIIPSSREIFIDKPAPGISYYYGIFDSELTKSGKFIFTPGENITLNSVETALNIQSISPAFSTRTIRTEPLPYLDVFPGIMTGKTTVRQSIFFPERTVINPETADILSKLLSSINDVIPPVPEIYIFPSDKEAIENSETYRLVRILNTDFTNKNWPEAYKLLGDFLSVRHTREVEVRTHFYLGQVLYFQEFYTKAFNEFVLAEGDYYKETKPWLDSLFYHLATASFQASK